MQISTTNLLASAQHAARAGTRQAPAKSSFELPDLTQADAAPEQAQPEKPAGPLRPGSLIDIKV